MVWLNVSKEINWQINLNKLKSTSVKEAVCQVWLKLWFWGRFFCFCLFGFFCPSWLFSTHMMISRRHHYQWRAANFDHYPELMAIQQWGFLACQPNVTWDICLQWLSPRICDTHTCCQALSSGAVTTCFNKLSLSQLGFKHPAIQLSAMKL